MAMIKTKFLLLSSIPTHALMKS